MMMMDQEILGGHRLHGLPPHQSNSTDDDALTPEPSTTTDWSAWANVFGR
jgi:hypothetical protein